MAGFDRRYVAVLGAAVDAARAVLSDLDDDDVPARLKRVARSTGGKLPLPLAVSLLTELDGSEWLRDETLEVLTAGGRGDEVSLAFLGRGEGWWLVVTAAVFEEAARSTDAEAGAVATEHDRLQQRLEAAKQREKSLRLKIEELESAASDRAEEAGARLRAASERERRRAARAEEQLATAGDELAAAVESVADAEERLRLLYERFLRVRAARADLEQRLAAGGRGGALPSDPVAIGRWLDDTARTLAPYRPDAAGGDEPPTAETEATPALPPGVRPDTAESIGWLPSLRPQRVLIDGHNVLGVIDPRSIGDAGARRSLIDGLGRLARFVAPAEVVVVFDSALAGGREVVAHPGGVTVRFSPPREAADDVLAEEARELGPRAVVISNDREVRERAAAAGAMALWADALVGWLSSPPRSGLGN